jgi:hypothetical protein
MKLKKLDRRHNGSSWFQFCAEYSNSDAVRFVEHRAWCWNTFGPSCELKFWPKAGKLGDRWCWSTDEWVTRIYLTSSAELNWFKLTHGVGV